MKSYIKDYIIQNNNVDNHLLDYQEIPCDKCNGKGFLFDDDDNEIICDKCGGEGYVIL